MLTTFLARAYDAPCVSKLFTNAFSYLVPIHVLYLALILVLPAMTSISVFHRVLNVNINSLLISLTYNIESSIVSRGLTMIAVN